MPSLIKVWNKKQRHFVYRPNFKTNGRFQVKEIREKENIKRMKRRGVRQTGKKTINKRIKK